MELYFQKLTEDGILAVHISNRYLDLQPVLANLAQDLQLAGLRQYDEDDGYPGKAKSDWVILARQPKAFSSLAEDSRWKAVEGKPAVGIWTDDYSNLLSVFDWKSYR
jgi:hypothetical protein